jgi:hypothetical protein
MAYDFLAVFIRDPRGWLPGLEVNDYYCGWINKHKMKYLSTPLYLRIGKDYFLLPTDPGEPGNLEICNRCPHQLDCVNGGISGTLTVELVKGWT